jgi:hypothetical protein
MNGRFTMASDSTQKQIETLIFSYRRSGAVQSVAFLIKLYP